MDQATGRPRGFAATMRDLRDAAAAERAIRAAEEERSELLSAMLRAEEEERSRIATALHDDTVQVMTAARLSLDRVAAALRTERPALLALVEQTTSTLETALDRTRHLMFELRPPLLEARGLRAAITDLADEAGSAAGFEPAVSIPARRYSAPVEELVYRTVREAIQNARKHSGARTLEITVEQDGGSLAGIVRDDGVGFDPEALDPRRMRLHLGLDALAERLRLARGHVHITSSPGNGCTIAFSVPIGPAADGPAPATH